MTTGEDVDFSDSLPDYRAIDPDVPVGHIPLAWCLELQAAATDRKLGPGAQFDHAWVGLETSMAMVREVNPQTGKFFPPREVRAAKDQAHAGFQTIMQNEQISPRLRAGAALALSSIGVHHEMIAKKRPQQASKSQVSYLWGPQAANAQVIRTLLAESDRTPEDDQLLSTIASLAIFTEYAQEKAWYSPAPPRQPWHLNAVDRRYRALARIMITDESPPEGIVHIPTETLGNRLWLDEPNTPHATLVALLSMPPGFCRPGAKATPKVTIFDTIAGRHFAFMNRHEKTHSSPTLAEATNAALAAQTEAAEPAKPQSNRPEIAWYLAQPAGDSRDLLDPLTLRIQLLNLEEAQAHGTLEPTQQHILGWMQFELARVLVAQAQEKRTAAERARVQATRVSRADAPSFVAAAEEADIAADQLIASVKERFDTIQNTFLAAAEAASKKQVEESFKMLLDAEAVPVYKALFTETDTAVLTEAVNTYVQGVMRLHKPMRAAELKLRHNPDELDTLQLTAITTTLCLLITDSSDEAARDLTLPTGPRASSIQGLRHAVVFPIDWVRGGYDTETPVILQIAPGDTVTHERQRITVGLNLLIGKGSIMGLLAKLAAKSGKKKRYRNENIDDTAYRITNAIADAIA